VHKVIKGTAEIAIQQDDPIPMIKVEWQDNCDQNLNLPWCWSPDNNIKKGKKVKPVHLYSENMRIKNISCFSCIWWRETVQKATQYHTSLFNNIQRPLAKYQMQHKMAGHLGEENTVKRPTECDILR